MAVNKDGIEGGKLLTLTEQADLNRKAHEAKYAKKLKTRKTQKPATAETESQVQQDGE